MPQTVFVEPEGELHSLVTNDGTRMVFAPKDQEVRFIVYGNYGAPPTNFITRRGYRQDGETEVYFQLAPRKISIEMHRSGSCTRQQYWSNRNDFHEILRPNRNGSLTLTLRTAGNVKRSLIVRADPGLVFPPPTVDENNWDITEVVNFVAFNPVWFDPASVSVVASGFVDTSLVFPITFPIKFGIGQEIFTATINYAGTWKAFPIITLTGPYSTAIVRNLTTGISLYMFGVVLAGDKRVITLTPGSLSIVDANGNNKFSELGTQSNLVDWNLRPNPEVAGGVNSIECDFLNATIGQSGFSLTYNNQYFAI